MAAKMAWLSILGYMPPLPSLAPQHLCSLYTPYLRKIYNGGKELAKAQIKRLLCFVSMRQMQELTKFPTVTYFGVSLSLGS